MQETATELYAPQPIGSDTSIPPDSGNILEDEIFLTVEIMQLWEFYCAFRGHLKADNQRLRTTRHDLSRMLFHMKQALAKPGRNGQWSAWLKEKEICRATADRLVQPYALSLNPDANCLTESTSEPTEAEIQRLVRNVLPRMSRMLRTPQSAYRFIDLLTTTCQGVIRTVSHEGIFIVKPTAQPDLPVQQAATVETSAGGPTLESQMAPARAEVEPDKEWI
jgi:hypothetical protein